MTDQEVCYLREKNITQWLLARGEQKMLEDSAHTTPLVALSAKELLRVDFAKLAEARRHWHTTMTTTSH